MLQKPSASHLLQADGPLLDWVESQEFPILAVRALRAPAMEACDVPECIPDDWTWDWLASQEFPVTPVTSNGELAQCGSRLEMPPLLELVLTETL
jgi:hypothetical protein